MFGVTPDIKIISFGVRQLKNRRVTPNGEAIKDEKRNFQGRKEIIYGTGKRAILSLSSSKILTPHPPVYPPPKLGGGHTRQAERGMGGQYSGRRDIGLRHDFLICAGLTRYQRNSGRRERPYNEKAVLRSKIKSQKEVTKQ